MKINSTYMSACLVLVCLACGCSTTSMQTIRGQSPEANAAEYQQAGFSNHHPIHAMKQEMHNMVYDQTAGYPYQTSYHSNTTYASGSSYCPPSGYESCPPGGQCPGGCRPGCIHHHHTYSVKTMQNPVYPDPQQTGGVVVYPYYTFKGPDCFFYKGD